MTTNLDLGLFFSTYGLILIAELPDKTAVAALLLATRGHPWAVFLGVAMAFLFQSFIAVTFGSLLGFLPREWIHLGAGVLFLIFSVLLWVKNKPHQKDLNAHSPLASGKKTFWTAFSVIFLAEWGDLTQLATATLAARHHAPWTIFISATLALWSVTALAVFAGSRFKKYLNPVLTQRITAVVFFIVGWVMILSTLKT